MPASSYTVTERLEAELRVQGCDVLLRVQDDGVPREIRECEAHELLSEALTTPIGAHDHPADEVPGVAVGGFGVDQGAEVGGGARGILNEVVHGRRLAVAVVEFGLVDALLEEEHVGAQLEERVHLVGGELRPSLHGTIRHVGEFNGARPEDCGSRVRREESALMTYKVEKTEAEWREELGSKYSILREAATERPWSGALLDEKRAGHLRVRRVSRPAVQERREVRLRIGLAELLSRPSNPDAVELKTDKTPRHDPHRGAVRELRLAPRAPLRRRVPDPHRRPVLHELAVARVQGGLISARDALWRRQSHPKVTGRRPFARRTRSARRGGGHGRRPRVAAAVAAHRAARRRPRPAR